MKTILVPVDFSNNSKDAMDYAISLANKLTAIGAPEVIKASKK